MRLQQRYSASFMTLLSFFASKLALLYLLYSSSYKKSSLVIWFGKEMRAAEAALGVRSYCNDGYFSLLGRGFFVSYAEISFSSI